MEAYNYGGIRNQTNLITLSNSEINVDLLSQIVQDMKAIINALSQSLECDGIAYHQKKISRRVTDYLLI